MLTPKEELFSRELLEYVNSRPYWKAEAVDIQLVPLDPFPSMQVTYYPCCDCGKPTLERIEVLDEPFCITGSEYMETCYECQVVSSD